jgi:hypothetical protein
VRNGLVAELSEVKAPSEMILQRKVLKMKCSSSKSLELKCSAVIRILKRNDLEMKWS